MSYKKFFVLLPAALFILAGSAIAHKTYSLKVSDPTTAGAHQLKPGDYTLAVDNARVSLTENTTGKKLELEAKVSQSAEKQYSNTAVHSEVVEGVRVIKEIQLGGTNTSVTFR